MDHRIGETRMMPTRPRQHLDPDHCPGHQGGRSPAAEERQRVTGRIVKPQKLKERSEEGQTAGGGYGCRAIAAKRRAGGNLAANCKDVGQCLVEIAHPLPQLCSTKHIRSQSKCKSALDNGEAYALAKGAAASARSQPVLARTGIEAARRCNGTAGGHGLSLFFVFRDRSNRSALKRRRE